MASNDESPSASDDGRDARVSREALLEAVASLAALAASYAEAGDADLADDPDAAAIVRSVVDGLAGFARKRRADDESRARIAIGSGLRNVYARVHGPPPGETEAPPSRRTFHEGAWQTADERRAAITRMLTRWFPTLDAHEAGNADLSKAEIEARGGPRAAADAAVTALFGRPRSTAMSPLEGATIFGLPLNTEPAVAFAAEAVARATRSSRASREQ